AAMKRRQTITSGATIGAQTLKQGDSHGAGSSPDISQKD
ncbi:MAG TPA: conjugal transfer protein TrbL, partial [Sphingopyxis sp.]|nr:conjugal transfer protein TrbL [Sphingopyxis sp.]